MKRRRTSRRLLVETLETRAMLTGVSDLVAEGELGTGPMPDFALEDVNATSSTHTQTVSPRDYLGQVSGWYFGFAT